MVEGGSSRDFAKIKEFAFGDPKAFDDLIDRLVAAIAAHLSAQIDAGVEVVQLFDTWAGIVPEEAFDRLVIAPAKRIVESLRRHHPRTPIIGFPRGIGPLYQKYFRATGVDAVSIDSGVSLEFAAKSLQPLGAVQGNLDPKVLVAGGGALDEAVVAIVKALRNGPFVFNLGHGVLPETPLEHVARLKELITRA
jgi:uroporphyrinogen decarboxylase